MRIAWDVKEIAGQKAGKGYYTFQLLKFLAKIDRQNQYFLYTDRDFQLPLPKNFKKVIIPKIFWLKYFWQSYDIKRKKIDFLFATTSYLLPLFVSCKTILTVHDLAVFYDFTRPRFKTWLIEKITIKYALQKAEIIIVPSESTKKELIKFFPFVKPKVRVIWEGVLRPKKAKKNLKNKQKFILSVGTIEPRKNFVNLIKAYQMLPARLRKSFRLIIIGKRGWHYKEILNLGAKTKGVKFLGYLPEKKLADWYRLASLFVYPSLYEGFGLPVIEAMSYGLPVICSNTTSLPEIAGGAALFFNPLKPKEISRVIQKVLDNPKLQKKLIQKALERAKKFSWEKCSRETLKIFQSLKNEKSI